MTDLITVDKCVEVGRQKPCNIVFKDKLELSARHIKIQKDGASTIIYMHGKNGGYLNGKFISQGEKRYLQYADEIDLLGIRMLWLDTALAVYTDCAQDYEVNYLKAYEMVKCELDTEGTYDNQLFSKAPRTFYPVNNEIIELDPPPEKHIEERQSLLMTVGPAFSMALPMIIGVMVTRMASRNTGISSAFMYTGLVTAVASALLGIIWGVTNVKNRRRQLLQNERKRKEIYRNYVRESELRIKEQYNKKMGNLRLAYPDIEEYISDGVNRTLLWNRNRADDDFLKVRIGKGNVPCNINVQIPKERFSMIEDELKDLPRRLKSKYAYMFDVPEVVDLSEEKIVGVVCDSKTDRSEIFLALLVRIAVTLSPEDIVIEYCFSSETVENDIINAVRFLPHFSKDKRYNEDKISIIFTDNYEKFQNHIDEKTYLFIISSHFEKLPSICRFIIQKENHFSGYMKLDKNCSIRRTIHFDTISSVEAEIISRRLQGIRVRCSDAKFVLPEKVSYMELFVHGISAEEICNRWKTNDIRSEILCPIGVSEDGNVLILDLHEKSMGPHGLIAGTTGSGKSEILQTIILSLAVNYSPEEVGFFLIDYKGGGMAKLFEDMPHVMGSISNLSGRMISRAMASVKAENERRQQIFINTGVNNINQYKSLTLGNENLEALPHVFIIIDEFAELKREEPEFMKDLISVARVGRSLGVHLILATQKPAGVVDDNVSSNSRFRICLRVQDRMDSMEMLRKPDAAMINNSGRAILQVGNDEIYKTFQGAYTMDKSDTSKKQRLFEVYDTEGNKIEKNTFHSYESLLPEPQLYKVLFYINQSYERIHLKDRKSLWLPSLPKVIEFPKVDFERFIFSIGIYDNPRRQLQDQLRLKLVDTGSILILGSLQSGKSTLLELISLSLLINTQIDFYNIYILDFSSGRLRLFNDCYMCDGYICEENEEDIGKLMLLLIEIIDERKSKIKNGGYSSYIDTKDAGDDGYIPPVVIIIDGMQSFRERTEGKYDKDIEAILKVSDSLGIYVLATAYNMNSHEIPKRMLDCFKTRIPLQLKDKYEYKEALKLQNSDFALPENISGRGLVCVGNDICEFQTYWIENLEKEILKTTEVTLQREDLLKYKRPLPQIPKKLDINTFIKIIDSRNEEKDNGIPVGFFTASGKVFYMPYDENLIVIISGRKGSGKTNLINVIRYISNRNNYKLKDEETADEVDEIGIERLEYCNGMKVYVYDEKLSFEKLMYIKKDVGDDPYVIHLGGALDRQNVADFSYIPYSKQTVINGPGIGEVRKTIFKPEYGQVVIPFFDYEINDECQEE